MTRTEPSQSGSPPPAPEHRARRPGPSQALKGFGIAVLIVIAAVIIVIAATGTEQFGSVMPALLLTGAAVLFTGLLVPLAWRWSGTRSRRRRQRPADQDDKRQSRPDRHERRRRPWLFRLRPWSFRRREQPYGEGVPAGVPRDECGTAGLPSTAPVGHEPVLPVHPPPRVIPLVVGATAETERVRLPLPRLVVAGARLESCFFGGRVPTTGWEVRGTSLRGFSHAEVEESGQDAMGTRWTPGRSGLLLAVADGVGSKHDSAQAATWAVELALQLAEERPTAPLDEHVIVVARELRRQLDKHQLSGATTLILAELTEADQGETQLRMAAVGDSEAWVLAESGWRALYHCRANNRTEALPRRPEATYQTIILPRGLVLVLATDGFAKALAKRSPLAVELRTRWANPPSEISFVNDVAFQDEHHLDDRTALAVWTGAV